MSIRVRPRNTTISGRCSRTFSRTSEFERIATLTKPGKKANKFLPRLLQEDCKIHKLAQKGHVAFSGRMANASMVRSVRFLTLRTQILVLPSLRTVLLVHLTRKARARARVNRNLRHRRLRLGVRLHLVVMTDLHATNGGKLEHAKREINANTGMVPFVHFGKLTNALRATNVHFHMSKNSKANLRLLRRLKRLQL